MRSNNALKLTSVFVALAAAACGAPPSDASDPQTPEVATVGRAGIVGCPDCDELNLVCLVAAEELVVSGDPVPLTSIDTAIVVDADSCETSLPSDDITHDPDTNPWATAVPENCTGSLENAIVKFASGADVVRAACND